MRLGSRALSGSLGKRSSVQTKQLLNAGLYALNGRRVATRGWPAPPCRLTKAQGDLANLQGDLANLETLAYYLGLS